MPPSGVTIYRVPVQLPEVPSPHSQPPFLDQKDFWQQLTTALEGEVRHGATITGDRTVDVVRSVDGLRHEVEVVIHDPAELGLSALDGQKVSGEAAAVRAVARALAQIGYGKDVAHIAVDNVIEVQNPTAT